MKNIKFIIIVIALFCLDLTLGNFASASNFESKQDTLLVTELKNHICYQLSTGTEQAKSHKIHSKSTNTLDQYHRYERARLEYLRTCVDQMRMINSLFLNGTNTQIADSIRTSKIVQIFIFILINVEGGVVTAELLINNALTDMIRTKEIIKYLKTIEAMKFPKISNTGGEMIRFSLPISKNIDAIIKKVYNVE